VQLRKYRCVDLVRLDAGIRNCTDKPGVRDDNTPHVRPYQALDGCAVAGRLQHDIVLAAQYLGKLCDRPVEQVYPQLSCDIPVLQDRDLGEGSVDVHADDAHAPPPVVAFGSRRACTTSTDPRSQRSRASRRGRPRNNSSSQLMVRTACRRFMLPAPLSRRTPNTPLGAVVSTRQWCRRHHAL